MSIENRNKALKMLMDDMIEESNAKSGTPQGGMSRDSNQKPSGFYSGGGLGAPQQDRNSRSFVGTDKDIGNSRSFVGTDKDIGNSRSFVGNSNDRVFPQRSPNSDLLSKAYQPKPTSNPVSGNPVSGPSLYNRILSNWRNKPIQQQSIRPVSQPVTRPTYPSITRPQILPPNVLQQPPVQPNPLPQPTGVGFNQKPVSDAGVTTTQPIESDQWWNDKKYKQNEGMFDPENREASLSKARALLAELRKRGYPEDEENHPSGDNQPPSILDLKRIIFRFENPIPLVPELPSRTSTPPSEEPIDWTEPKPWTEPIAWTEPKSKPWTEPKYWTGPQPFGEPKYRTDELRYTPDEMARMPIHPGSMGIPATPAQMKKYEKDMKAFNRWYGNKYTRTDELRYTPDEMARMPIHPGSMGIPATPAQMKKYEKDMKAFNRWYGNKYTRTDELRYTPDEIRPESYFKQGKAKSSPSNIKKGIERMSGDVRRLASEGRLDEAERLNNMMGQEYQRLKSEGEFGRPQARVSRDSGNFQERAPARKLGLKTLQKNPKFQQMMKPDPKKPISPANNPSQKDRSLGFHLMSVMSNMGIKKDQGLKIIGDYFKNKGKKNVERESVSNYLKPSLKRKK